MPGFGSVARGDGSVYERLQVVDDNVGPGGAQLIRSGAAVDPDDVTALTRCIDHVVGAQRG